MDEYNVGIMAEKEKSMSVVIGGRKYPLIVDEEEEKAVLGIVEEINHKISDFQMTYTDRDKQDFIAMTLLTYALEVQKLRQNGSGQKSIADQLEKLENLIDENLV